MPIYVRQARLHHPLHPMPKLEKWVMEERALRERDLLALESDVQLPAQRGPETPTDTRINL